MHICPHQILRTGLALGCLLFAAVGQAAVETNGPANSVSVTNSPAGNPSFLFTLTNGVAEVTPYAPDVVRVRFHFGSNLYQREEVAIAKSFTNWPAFAVSYTNQATNVLITTSQLRVEVVMSNRFQVHFRDSANRDLLRDQRIEFDLGYHMIGDTNAYAQVNWPNGVTSVSNRPAGFKLKAVKEMPAGQAYFGLGDFGGPLNRRGRVLQFWNQDTYQFTESHNPKYAALPFWYGMQPSNGVRDAFAYGLFFNNPARPVVDFASTNGHYTFEAGDDQLDYFFFGGGSNQAMAAILDRFSELTGRPVFLPKWAHGYHQSRHSYYTQQDTMDLIATFRSSNIPCDAVYLDIGVQALTNTQPAQLTFNPVAYTNVPALTAYATNQGVHLVPIVETLLTTNDPLYAASFASTRFIKQNNLANYVGSNFLGAISWLDFSIEETRDWWTGQLTNYLATYGFTALWNDLTEPNENAMPLDTLWYLDGRYSSTSDTRRWHSNNKDTYAVLAAQVSERALRTRQPSIRPFVLTRGAWPGVQSYAAGWSGDNVSSFDHLRFNTRLAVSVMISGQANYGNDVGGFVGSPGAELLTRWLQAGVFSPLYRNHNYLDLFTPNPQEPWVHGEPYTLWNRRIIQFRYQLMPYLYTLAHQAATSGVPMNVPVAFYYTADTNTWNQSEYDFLVGRDLLAAPVVASGAVTRTIYLPAGNDWYFAGDDTRYSGGQSVEVRASLGGLPFFVRAGGIVPQGPAMDYVDAFAPDYLDVHVWPGATNVFTLYEDDGVTTNYRAGVSAHTPIQVAGSTTNLLVAVGPRSGTFIPPARSWYVVAHGLSNSTQVTANGVALSRFGHRAALEAEAGPGWCMEAASRQVVAKVVDDGALVDLIFSGHDAGAAAPGFISAYSNMAVAGTFTYWNEAARNMALVAHHTWAWVATLDGCTNAEFKFVGNDAWTTANWGETNQTDAEAPLVQTAEWSGSNIALTNFPADLYVFLFNETSLTYSVTSAVGQDSDGDGLPDVWEYAYGLSPTRAGDGSLDPDADGLANSNEYQAGSSPLRADTDGDGLLDPDEWLAGTGASNALSYFAVATHLRNPTNGGASVGWNAVTGRSYDLCFSTNLLPETNWFVLPPFSNLTGSGSLSVTDTNAAALKFYRLDVRKTP
jgi:alpha-glucosidase